MQGNEDTTLSKKAPVLKITWKRKQTLWLFTVYDAKEQRRDSGIRALKSKPVVGRLVVPKRYISVKALEPGKCDLLQKKGLCRWN